LLMRMYSLFDVRIFATYSLRMQPSYSALSYIKCTHYSYLILVRSNAYHQPLAVFS
jgi:hypothetical protein